VVIYETPQKRATWAPKGKDGWYIGPALDAYRVFRVWVWDTQHERSTDTLSWFPHNVSMPIASYTDMAIASLRDMTKALLHPTPPNALPLDDTEATSLADLADMFPKRDPNLIIPAEYKELRNSSDGTHWIDSCSNEFGRLAQGRQPTMPTGTDTIFFIHKHNIPKGKKATYLRIVCDDRPHKIET
jgi:hypothetical protein